MPVFSTEEDMRDERAFSRLVNHEPVKTKAEELKSEEKQIEEAA